MSRAQYMREYRKDHPAYRDQEAARERGRGPRKRDRTRRYEPRDLQPFAGVDGEGATWPGQRHRYVLLRCGPEVITDNGGLRTVDLLEWLVHLPTDYLWTSFFFDYDVTMILRGVPWSRLQTWKPGGNLWFKDYFITYMPKTEFAVSKRMPDPTWTPDSTKPKTMIVPGTSRFAVYDSQKLFQTSFVKAITQWQAGTQEVRDKIAYGKLHLRVDATDLSDDLAEYNRLECETHAEMMEKVREAALDLDLKPTRWTSPGQLAQAMFRKHDVPRAVTFETRWGSVIKKIGEAAYHSGRFEGIWYGPVPGPCINGDLKSAYPWAMRDMWCPKHASWEHRSPGASEQGFVYAQITHDNIRDGGPFVCALPHRSPDGSICYPTECSGWYWNFEVEQAREQCGMHVTIWDGWTLVPGCEHKPTAFMQEMFDERVRLGSSDRGMVLKLGMNSGYGKFAQTVGTPAYSHHVIASWITARTRTEMMRMIHSLTCERGLQCGSTIVMLATDGIYSRGDYWPAPSSSLLGGWETEILPGGMFVVQSGVYFKNGLQAAIASRDSDREVKGGRTRGTPLSILVQNAERLGEAWHALIDDPESEDATIKFPYTRFIGLREALHRGHPRMLGNWQEIGGDDGKEITFSWHIKRDVVPLPAEGLDRYGCRQTAPRTLRPGYEDSVPYGKAIPWRDNPVLADKDLDDTPEEWPVLFNLEDLQ
jgi:hypothetical protein